MKSKIKASIPIVFSVLLYLSLTLFLLIGWVLNIIAVINTTSNVFDGMFIARIVGIFVAPVGSILGYF